MKEQIIGYSLALFTIAKEEGKIVTFKSQALQIIDAIEENLEIIKIMNSRTIDINEKLKLIDNVFSSIDPMIKNFLSILAQRSKFHSLINILKKLIKFVNEDKKIKEGVVYSTIKLSSSEIQKLSQKVGNLLHAKVDLINKLDATLVSGIKIQVGDEIIEDSMNTRLVHLKNQLLEREEN